MAYSNNYNYMYGFGLLDDLHNFYPEMLYDETLFPDRRFGWFRHRTSTLFPEVYVRQQNMYRIYHAANRQAQFTEWVNSQQPTPATPVRPTTIPRTAPNAPARRTFMRTQGDDLSPEMDILTALFTVPTTTTTARISNNLFGSADLLSILTNHLNFQDVVVIPTIDQINAGSRSVDHEDIPADVTCAICQEHTVAGNQPVPWRRLHCSHQFHSTCIIPWFQRNVHCPVCRADVRTPPRAAAGTGETGLDHDDMSTSTTSSPTSVSPTPPEHPAP